MTSSAPPPTLAGPIDAPPTARPEATRPDGVRARRIRFAAMAATYVGFLGAMVAVTVVRNDGTFTYAIDDPMIHLTIARNLGRAGTFGVVPGVYESASSAPLWNVLLAPVLAVVEDAWWLPLVANVAAGLWLLWIVSDLPALARSGSRRRGVLLSAVLVFLLGLVPLTMSGMEHTLHASLAVAFLVLLARRGTDRERRGDLAWLLALTALGTLLRFETAFLAVAAAAVLLLEPPRRAPDASGADPSGGRPHRPWFVAAALVGAAALPALAFAAMNRAFGQNALPNSVVAKSDVGRGRFVPTPSDVVDNLSEDELLFALLVLAVGVLVIAWWGPWATATSRRATRALTTALFATGLHVAYADVGWFDRYEAYLIASLVVGFAIVVPELRTWPSWRRWAVPFVCLLCLLRVPLHVRTPLATSNIYENQYQLGQLFETSYRGRGVAVNDLGYVSWFHDGPVLDIVGLGSFEALQARQDRDLDAERFAELADAADVEVLAIYDLFDDLVPAGWSEAGRWCVDGPLIILLRECVVFYAPDGEPLATARAALTDYAPRLPPGTTSTVTSP